MDLELERLAPGFLVAAPLLRDPNFERSVVLMCVHNEQGAMGLVINRPSPFQLKEIMEQLKVTCTEDLTQDALVGGPVALENGLLLYRVLDGADQRDDELVVTPELRLCPSRELLQSIGLGQGPKQFHMFLGHSGWGPGQLEGEISAGAWIPTAFDMDLIFETPMQNRWEQALRSEGINPAQLGFNRPQA